MVTVKQESKQSTTVPPGPGSTGHPVRGGPRPHHQKRTASTRPAVPPAVHKYIKQYTHVQRAVSLGRMERLKRRAKAAGMSTPENKRKEPA